MRALALAMFCTAVALASAALASPAPGTQDSQPPPYAQALPQISPEAESIAKAGAREVSTGDPDEDATLAVVADFEQRGMAALGEHEAALRKVLGDMPRPFVREGSQGVSLIYRGDSMADCIAFATTLKDRPGGARHFICKGNPYAVAAFYLGSFLNETRRYDEALAALDLGLEAAPNSPVLISERDAALMALRRWNDTVVGAERGLAIPNLSPKDRARLLRNLGYALTELQRLDEAQRAYEESLRLEPGSALALNELRYLAGALRPTPQLIARSSQAADRISSRREAARSNSNEPSPAG